MRSRLDDLEITHVDLVYAPETCLLRLRRIISTSCLNSHATAERSMMNALVSSSI